MVKEKQQFSPEKSKHDRIYEEVYLPKVIENIGEGKWTTATGVTIDIYQADTALFEEELCHLMSTAYSYVREVLKNKYIINGKKWAACSGKGVYPRFMTDDEIKEWRQVKKQYSDEAGEKLTELTQAFAQGMIGEKEFCKEAKKLGSWAFAQALIDWIKEKGYIPVMINHYEPKIEIIQGAFID